MSKFITKFETQAAYEAARENLILPNVSLVKDNAEVHYAPFIKVSGVSLNKSELSLAPNVTETLVATVLPNDASNKQVTWSSSNQSVATVSSNGVVTAVGGGNATITVTTVDGGFTAQCSTNITVSVTGVTLNKSSLKLGQGATETLVATVLPSNASNKAVTWSSSNQSVATVSSNGLVTAVGNIGDSTTITVTTVDGGFSAECAVKIPQMINGHEYVEIGGLKWSTMYVGANNIYGFGDYYQYGKGDKVADETGWDPIYSGTSPLPKSADTASQVWGGSWRTPTKAEFESLMANTTYSYKTIDGQSGAVFTDKNDSSKTLFFRLAGLYDRSTGRPSGGAMYVMSSERKDSSYIWNLQGTTNACIMGTNGIQQYGYSVRPVAD